MSIEEEEVLEAKPKKRGRKPKAETSNKITGKVNNDGFTTAVSDIEKDSLVAADDVAAILKTTMEQAYLEWSYPGLFKNKDDEDPDRDLIKAEVDFGDTYEQFRIYDIKTVTEEDDIIDDAYQISVEDAQEYSKGAVVGDTIRIPFDVTRLDKSYVRRVKQLFQSHLKDASRAAILSAYKDQIGNLIEGQVTKASPENNEYELSFGKADGFLKRNQLIENEKFSVGERVLVYLRNVSENSNPPSLLIDRTSDNFIAKLMEKYVPEIADGIVKIVKIVREAGKRTKIFVESTNPNVDPIGACVGPESSRKRNVQNEARGEKIDILVYHQNKAMQIIEAMKPADVVGLTVIDDFFDPNVHFDEIEKDKGYEYPKITVVVNNGNQGVAIGNKGVNVRLATKLTCCTLSVLQSDEAMKKGLKYAMVSDVQKLANETVATAPVEVKPAEELDEEEEPIVLEPVLTNEGKIEAVPEVQPAAAPAEETPAAEAVAAPAAEPAPVAEPAPEPVPEPVAEPVVHVEIKNKPKISLEELEQAMTAKKGPSETRSRKRFKKEEEKKETASAASQANAMPIYTQEELDQMDAENGEEEYDENLDEDLDLADEYDNDEYYGK